MSAFREKPSADLAETYFQSGDYFWNAGIFLWSVETIEKALTVHQPDMSQRLTRIAEAWGSSAQDTTLTREFAAITGISIDYAVMEHATDVAVIPASFQWDDVGSWQSIARLKGRDSDGNSITGRHLGLRTKGSIVQTDDEHLVVTVGIEDCIVVRTPDATLVANKHDEEAIREIVQQLEERGWHDVL